jgi:hypothetical protein
MPTDSSCNIPAKYTPIAINIGIHVMILFCILSCLFYFLISKVETSTINGELTSNIDDIVESLTQDPEISSYLNGQAQTAIASKLKEAYIKPNEVATTNNKWLFRSVIIANVGIFLIILIVILLLVINCNECISIWHIIAENIGTFLLVGVIEILFFLKVAIQYVPVHPDIVSNTFLNEMSKNLA